MNFLQPLNPYSWTGYERIVNAIIRPPRASYTIDQLGPPRVLINGVRFERREITLTNSRGLVLKCSHWTPARSNVKLPCVVYLHGNAGCRADALSVANVVLSLGISLFAFDFSGSGQSDGEYISLGWWEREDVAAVVAHLRENPSVSTIGLWGRSMGAATALLHGDRDPSIAAMVVDSPFSSLTKLAHELVGQFAPHIPSPMTSGVLSMVASSCKDKVNFNIADLEPIAHVDSCYIPALFATGDKDKFILPHHARDLHAKYAGDKCFKEFPGDHHSQRSAEFFDTAAHFLHERLTQAATTLETSYRKRRVAPPQPVYSGPTSSVPSSGPAQAVGNDPNFVMCSMCGQLCQAPGMLTFRCPSCNTILQAPNSLPPNSSITVQPNAEAGAIENSQPAPQMKRGVWGWCPCGI